jgi:2,3-bisphosphoglycerate-dependent phosphoglycerate mutase
VARCAVPLRILLIRHGQTASNAAGVLQGHLPTPLNALGVAQAECLAARMSTLEPRVGVLVASDLRRALETAQPIASGLGLSVEPDAAWRERAFGPLEGKTVGDAEVWRAATGTLDPPGAEPLDALRARVEQAICALVTRHRTAGALAVVTHGGVIRTTLGLLADGRLALAAGEARPEGGAILNGSILHLDVDEQDQWRVLRVNDVDHLAALDRTAADAG